MNMKPESLDKHRPFLNFIYYIGSEQFGKLFMTDAQVLLIREIIENILLGNLPLSGTQIGELRKFQKVLRHLSTKALKGHFAAKVKFASASCYLASASYYLASASYYLASVSY